jgi:hypothetical protein
MLPLDCITTPSAPQACLTTTCKQLPLKAALGHTPLLSAKSIQPRMTMTLRGDSYHDAMSFR